MTTSERLEKRDALFVIVASALAAVALIATTISTTRGPLVLIPYALLSVATLMYLHRNGVDFFARRFTVAFAALMLPTFALHAYLTTGASAACPSSRCSDISGGWRSLRRLRAR
jgi:hypothetical protein